MKKLHGAKIFILLNENRSISANRLSAPFLPCNFNGKMSTRRNESKENNGELHKSPKKIAIYPLKNVLSVKDARCKCCKPAKCMHKMYLLCVVCVS